MVTADREFQRFFREAKKVEYEIKERKPCAIYKIMDDQIHVKLSSFVNDINITSIPGARYDKQVRHYVVPIIDKETLLNLLEEKNVEVIWEVQETDIKFPKSIDKRIRNAR